MRASVEDALDIWDGTIGARAWVLAASFVERRGGAVERTLSARKIPVEQPASRPARLRARAFWVSRPVYRPTIGVRKAKKGNQRTTRLHTVPRGSERSQPVRAAQALAVIGVSAGGRTLAMTCTAPGPPPIGCPPDGPSVPGGADIAAASSKSLVVVDLTIRISLASYFSLRAKSR